MRFLAFITAIALSISGCKTPKVANSNSANTDKVVLKMERTGCYGRCPIYQVTIHGNGLLEYNAVRFTEKDGQYTATLSKDDLRSVLDAAQSAKLFDMADKYPVNRQPPVDVPSCIVTYTEKDKVKKIVDYRMMDTPDALTKLEKLVDEVLKKQKLQDRDK